MRDAPSKILLIVGPYPGFVRDWARSMGLSAALTSGRVRIITKPGQLRGWQNCPPFHVVGSDQMDGDQRAELAAAIKAYVQKREIRWASPRDVQEIIDEVAA